MQLDRSKIDLAMAKAGKSIKEVAEAYGATTQRVNVIFNSVNITPKTLYKLAKALETEPEELLEEVKR